MTLAGVLAKGARLTFGSFRPATSSLRFGDFHQLLDRHRDDIG